MCIICGLAIMGWIWYMTSTITVNEETAWLNTTGSVEANYKMVLIKDNLYFQFSLKFNLVEKSIIVWYY